jgi:pyrroline-5-carboxylate reductase
MQAKNIIGFIGAGKMAEAIISRILRVSSEPVKIIASDINPKRCSYMQDKYGILCVPSNIEVVKSTKTVFLAVKPQDMDKVLKEIASHATADHIFISIAAGKKIASIESYLQKSRIMRIMPNLPVMVGEGMIVLTCGKHVSTADSRKVKELLQSCGKVLELSEDSFDAVTALSGSGPAFFCYVLNAMATASASHKLPYKTALFMAKQTMLGTARFLLEKNIEPEDFIASVASPRGTTAAGLQVIDKKKVNKIFAEVITAAVKRSKELSDTLSKSK